MDLGNIMNYLQRGMKPEDAAKYAPQFLALPELLSPSELEQSAQILQNIADQGFDLDEIVPLYLEHGHLSAFTLVELMIYYKDSGSEHPTDEALSTVKELAKYENGMPAFNELNRGIDDLKHALNQVSSLHHYNLLKKFLESCQIEEGPNYLESPQTLYKEMMRNREPITFPK